MTKHQQTATLPSQPGTSVGRPPGGVGLPPVGPVRRSLAVLAGAATLPYLGLKVAWLAGSSIGLRDPDFGRDPAMVTLNALTMSLDVVALALALVLVTRRGLRAPAWLVLPPMWVGAGLLGQILVSLPISLVVGAVTPSRPSTGELPPIEGWVFAMVYTDFGLLGVGLLGAFAVHAWQRWGGRSLASPSPGDRRRLTLAAALAGVAGLVHVALSAVPLGSRLLDLAVAGVGAGALLALARPTVRAQAAVVAVVLAFVATGAMTAWGTYLTVLTVVPNDLVGQTDIDWVTVGANVLRAAAGFAGVGALVARLRRAGRAVRA